MEGVLTEECNHWFAFKFGTPLLQIFQEFQGRNRKGAAIVPAALSSPRRSTTTMLSWFLGDATKIPGRFQKVAWCQQNSARRKYTFRKGYIYNGITRYQGLFPIYF